MLRVRLFPVLLAILIGVALLAAPARAQTADAPATIDEMPFPGDFASALAAIDDRATPDRAQFMLETIRRIHAVSDGRHSVRDKVLQSLLRRIEAPRITANQRTAVHAMPSARVPPVTGLADAGGPGRDPVPSTLPLPLSQKIWIDVVFAGRSTAESLVVDILRSRNAALLYCALLALDESTRAWLASQPALLGEIAAGRPAALMVAAPGLRVAEHRVQLPGGAAAIAGWEALVERRVDEPVEFVRALLTHSDGRLAYFLGALGQLTPSQISFALTLEASDPADRVEAIRKLAGVFDRIAAGWVIEQRAFWRPILDPALLVASLDIDEAGRPHVPGTRRFWSAVFDDAEPKPSTFAHGGSGDSSAVDLSWLSEQIFKGSHTLHRAPYQMILFASRTVGAITPDNAYDAAVTIRSMVGYPALAATLERSGLTDVSAFAAAARRAERLANLDDHPRAARALAQFQGAIFLVTRAALRGSLPIDALPQSVSSLAAVEHSDRGDYEGRLATWLAAFVAAHKAQTSATSVDGTYADAVNGMDADLLRMAAGRNRADWGVVEWEGTRYRVDFAAAEASRIARLLGADARPYLSAARGLVAIADALSAPTLTRDALQSQTAAIESIARSGRWDDAAAESFRRAARITSPRDAARLAAMLRVLADDLLGRGLTTLAYAVSLGHSDSAMLDANEAAARHDFGLEVVGSGRAGAWRLPSAGSDRVRDWRATGSLLGLDVRLADFALLRLTSRPPSRRPSLNDADRRAFIESVATINPHALTDAGRDVLLGAMRRGRARVERIETADQAEALAAEIRLGPARRSLLPWTLRHDRDRLASFLSPAELVWLGLEGKPLDRSLHAWGAPAEARAGCLCLRLNDRLAPEAFAGRWDSGLFASAFPDVNLRLSELLAGLKMPASLLAPVQAAAVLDFVNGVESRDADDRRGLVEFADRLSIDRVEQYLALLTTDGPLVPIADVTGAVRDEPIRSGSEADQ